MKKTTALFLTVLLSGSAPLVVQGQETPAQSGQDQKQQQQQPAAEESKQQLKISDEQMRQQVKDINKASKLMGTKVKNQQEEELGKISDLVVDFRSGKIAYAVLSHGGTLGIGGKQVAIPMEAFTVQQGEEVLLLNLSKQQLAQASGFEDKNWPDLNAAEKGQTIGLAKMEKSEAAGGTGSESQQVKGGGDSQTVTNLQQLAGAEAKKFEGKQVNLSGVAVQEVLGHNLLTLSSQGGQQMLVKSQQPIQGLKQGQQVQVSGTLRKMPSDASQLGINQETAQKIQGQQHYIEAAQVNPAAQQP